MVAETTWHFCDPGEADHDIAVLEDELLEKILLDGHTVSESIWALPLGDDRYELRNDCVLFDASYGTVVVANGGCDERGFPVVLMCEAGDGG